MQEHLVSFSRNWVQNGQRTTDCGQRNAIVLLINYAEQRRLTPTHTHIYTRTAYTCHMHCEFYFCALIVCVFSTCFGLNTMVFSCFIEETNFLVYHTVNISFQHFIGFFIVFPLVFFFSCSIVYVECSDFSNLTRHVHIWLTDGLISEENEDTTRAFFSELPQPLLTGTLWTFGMSDLSDKLLQKIAFATSAGILNMREKKAKLFAQHENIVLQIFDTNFPALNRKLISFFLSHERFFFHPIFKTCAQHVCAVWFLGSSCRTFFGIHLVSS